MGSGSGAGHKRKHEKELGQAGIESRKRPRRSQPAAVPPPNLDQSNPIIQSSEKLATELLKAHEIDPISYWAAHHTWPMNFAEHPPMASSNSTNKRQRTSDGKNEKSRSYSQCRKDGEVPEQYTAAYERHILIKGLDMDPLKGEELVSEESKKLCINLQQITHKAIKSTIFPTGVIRKVINFCRNRNEAIVNRDITPMIVPPIISLYFDSKSNLEHVVDEVNADWYSQCVLEGPQLRPDLAIGLFPSAFTQEEIEKLKRYNSVNNWTQLTMHMLFPFLMCEVKCVREGLDIADRQNMHSCSVAVRALLRIEQEADKYRPQKEMEKKLNSLNGQVLVFSISHDQQDARLYGHYATVQGENWTYYRYRIRKFDLTDSHSLLAIHNFVQNILKSHLPGHVKRLKDALAALPDPNKPPESVGLPSSSGLSLAASEISLHDDNSQQDSQERDADGFVVPPRPENSQNGGAKKTGSDWEVVTMLRQDLERQRQENERQRQEMKEENEELKQQIKKLMEALTQSLSAPLKQRAEK